MTAVVRHRGPEHVCAFLLLVLVKADSSKLLSDLPPTGGPRDGPRATYEGLHCEVRDTFEGQTKFGKLLDVHVQCALYDGEVFTKKSEALSSALEASQLRTIRDVKS